MTRISLTLAFAGTEAELDLSGAVYWPEWRLLTVADLHFEKGSSFAASRYLPVPPHDTTETLLRLEALIQEYAPRQVICLGDSFHDRTAAARLSAADLDMLHRLAAQCDWTWLSGNHDPAPPADIAGRTAQQLLVGGILFRHDFAAEPPLPSQARAIVFGHYHPVAVLSTGGRLLRRKCFACAPDRLLLPAFGIYTGGMNVLDPVLRQLFAADLAVIALGRGQLYPIATSRLRRDGMLFR